MSDEEIGERTLLGIARSRRLPAGVDRDRRSPSPADWLKWLPLALAVVAGIAGYVRTQADVEVLRRDVDRNDARINKQWERLGEHERGHAQ